MTELPDWWKPGQIKDWRRAVRAGMLAAERVFDLGGEKVTKIHESGYGDSPNNFHVSKRGNELHVDLTYPPWTDAENKHDQCRYVFVDQEATRASDGVRLHYDYRRDGFVVEQPRPYMVKTGENSYDCRSEWIEVGFFPSWKFDVPEDEQMAAAEKAVVAGTNERPADPRRA